MQTFKHGDLSVATYATDERKRLESESEQDLRTRLAGLAEFKAAVLKDRDRLNEQLGAIEATTKMATAILANARLAGLSRPARKVMAMWRTDGRSMARAVWEQYRAADSLGCPESWESLLALATALNYKGANLAPTTPAPEPTTEPTPASELAKPRK